MILSAPTLLSPSKWRVTSPSQILAETRLDDIKRMKVVVVTCSNALIAREPEFVIGSSRISKDEKSDRKFDDFEEAPTKSVPQKPECELEDRVVQTDIGPSESEGENATSSSRLISSFNIKTLSVFLTFRVNQRELLDRLATLEVISGSYLEVGQSFVKEEMLGKK